MSPGGWLELVVSARETETAGIDGVKRELLAVSVFLVNARPEALRRFGDVAFCFQARLQLDFPQGFERRDDRASYDADGFDERLADLHYRDVCSFAVGHNTSGDWAAPAEGRVASVFTNPLPAQQVEKLGADIPLAGVERGMEALAEAAIGVATLGAALDGLPAAYARWAQAQVQLASGLKGVRRREVAKKCLTDVETARKRIEAGIARLKSDVASREAFVIMNRVMAQSNRQRGLTLNGKPPDQQDKPIWRLFQLAFILLNLDGLADPTHPDRPIVDLLFFPTGGGKTEAYLGLAAFAIARRRLNNPGLERAGLSVVMRYTLRLLTLDQLQRAAGLVCALELQRKAQPARLGSWPIEIGLWVGGAATPNNLGSAKNRKENTAVFWLEQHRKGSGPAPAPLKSCPWCGTKFNKDSFRLRPTAATPQRLDIHCDSVGGCPFATGDRLPIVVVDEEIYRRQPAFMIATIDKFASVPWEGRAGAFFGHVERYDQSGFYGAAEPGGGTRLGGELRPIDLIIQDELHLISGPLGTIAGLYETAFDLLASRLINGERRGPKIVASTATVRRAETQIRNLFGREQTAIFPPPGIDRTNSFFAEVEKETPSRLYVGVASPGRGPKLVFLRALQTLLAGATALSSGGRNDPADPYLTTLCYFNALRELGGARRIVDDEVRAHLTSYGRNRVRREPTGAPFANRTLREIQELTSRYSTDQVSEARTRLGDPACEKNAVDVALATNMISVGLDIGRLGLMVVQGQPKTAAEYIQATSRVGSRSAQAWPRRDAAEHPQAARPHALRTVPRLPYELLPRGRGDERDTLCAPRAGPRSGRNARRRACAMSIRTSRPIRRRIGSPARRAPTSGSRMRSKRRCDPRGQDGANHSKMSGAPRRIEDGLDRHRGQADAERRRLRLRKRRARPAPAPGPLRTAAEHGSRTRVVPRGPFDARHRAGGPSEDQTARRRRLPLTGRRWRTLPRISVSSC